MHMCKSGFTVKFFVNAILLNYHTTLFQVLADFEQILYTNL